MAEMLFCGFVKAYKFRTSVSHKFVAEDGVKGGDRKCMAEVVRIHMRSSCRNRQRSRDRKIVADFTEDGQKIIAAKGGRGGLGNMHYANSEVRQAPQFATPGLPGEEHNLRLSLSSLPTADSPDFRMRVNQRSFPS